MKKIIIFILLLLILVGCSPKKEEYYNIKIEDEIVAVGYDTVSTIDNLPINSYKTHLDKKENEILDYLEFYIDDLANKDVYIDETKISTITGTCDELGGEIVTNNGKACVLHKKVKEDNDIVILYGNILDDDTNRVDRVEVIYELKED